MLCCVYNALSCLIFEQSAQADALSRQADFERLSHQGEQLLPAESKMAAQLASRYQTMLSTLKVCLCFLEYSGIKTALHHFAESSFLAFAETIINQT